MMKKTLVIYLCMLIIIPAISISAIANSPPSVPEIHGPTSGKAGVEYTYEICTEDPDGDDIIFCIDWDEGAGEICTTQYPSGTCIEVSHTWSEEGSYTIKVKAEDIHGAESDWATLGVSMPKTKPIISFALLFEELIERFPILRYIL